jgi:GntR family transcriptional regulator
VNAPFSIAEFFTIFLDLEFSRLDLSLSLCYICSTVFRKPNPSSGVPIYVQLKEQIRHAIETGALSAGDQLPGIRGLAETLVINPNTVIKVYRDLEQEGVLEIRHGLGAFIASRRRSRSKTEELRDAQRQVHEFVETLKDQGLDEGEIRRLFEAELAGEFQRR